MAVYIYDSNGYKCSIKFPHEMAIRVQYVTSTSQKKYHACQFISRIFKISTSFRVINSWSNHLQWHTQRISVELVLLAMLQTSLIMGNCNWLTYCYPRINLELWVNSSILYSVSAVHCFFPGGGSLLFMFLGISLFIYDLHCCLVLTQLIFFKIFFLVQYSFARCRH